MGGQKDRKTMAGSQTGPIMSKIDCETEQASVSNQRGCMIPVQVQSVTVREKLLVNLLLMDGQAGSGDEFSKGANRCKHQPVLV